MSPHQPVMVREMIAAMAPRDGETYLDATFGAGGYSRALLGAAKCTVYAIDRDPNVAQLANALAQEFPGRFVFVAGCFGDMLELLAQHGVASVDGIVMDIGVSSMQIDEAERGFSFRADGPLDMRMSSGGLSAADIVNGWDEDALANVIYRYGEEKASRKVAKAIVTARSQGPITRTLQLAEIVRGVVHTKPGTIDPATRTFQALRIEVNRELDELERALADAPALLAEGGRLVVVTFHSLEDRMVKQALQRGAGKNDDGNRHLPLVPVKTQHIWHLPRGWMRRASEAEVDVNPRARSATLRVAIRGTMEAA